MKRVDRFMACNGTEFFSTTVSSEHNMNEPTAINAHEDSDITLYYGELDENEVTNGDPDTEQQDYHT